MWKKKECSIFITRFRITHFRSNRGFFFFKLLNQYEIIKNKKMRPSPKKSRLRAKNKSLARASSLSDELTLYVSTTNLLLSFSRCVYVKEKPGY